MSTEPKAVALECPDTPEKIDRSRREFLGTAVPGLALAAALPAVAAPVAQNDGLTGVSRHALEDVLARYGSELGAVSRVK